MYDIDVHIIRFNEPDWMMERCLKSLEGQPVNIHIVPGIRERPPVVGRRLGFAAGSAPYCSLVDPDDTVEIGAFAEMLKYSGHDVIHGNERVLINGVEKMINQGIHHAFLVRRGVVGLDYSCGHYGLIEAVGRLNLSVKHIDQVFYAWNMSTRKDYGLGEKANAR